MRHVAVIGAGAFGGWAALALRRRGARVTLVDAWGPGNARASSGGETRVIRATYGSHALYTRMAGRALELWRDCDAEAGGTLLRMTGVLWMIRADDGFGRASVAALRDAGLPIDELTPREAARRFPQIDFAGVASVLWEPEAGYLFARRACEDVVRQFIVAGGEYRQASVKGPVDVDGAPVSRVPLDGGGALEADAFVFACGPWLGRLFPDTLGPLISVTRQEVYYFGPPAGDARFGDPAMPVWLDYGDRVIYGIPDNAHRGFKVADDTSGPPMDPTAGPRGATDAGVAAVRAFMERRFPAMAGAPLLGAEVCQYESTPDSHFIVDRHPAAANVWIAGGGSGHGFKMGPVFGDLIASGVLDDADVSGPFGVARFAGRPSAGWQKKWS
jgi:glycine/D-amino acid oxidase-like deaminating enzyme